MKNYIVLHGSFGSKDGNWFPWLREEIEIFLIMFVRHI